MIDLHIHSKHSHDGKNPIEEFIQKAQNEKVKIIGFAEHLDLDYAPFGIQFPMINIEKYLKHIAMIKEQTALKVLCGLEIGYEKSPEIIEKYNQITKDPRIDFVINSVHLVDGIDYFFPSAYKGKNNKQVYEHYLLTVLGSVKSDVNYNIVGHIGYIARYAPESFGYIRYPDFADIIDMILRVLVEKDKCLEINTHTKNPDMPFIPDIGIVKRYFELGGDKISFGSDSHTAERAPMREYTRAGNVLKDIGFKYLTYYENKTAKHIKI